MVKRGSIESYRLISRLSKRDILQLSRMTCRHGHSYLSHGNCALSEGVLMESSTPKGRKIYKLKEKVGFLDIETFSFNFKGDMSVVLSYCIKELDGKVVKNCITSKECNLKSNWDLRLMKDLVTDLKEYTRIIGHFSTLFDLPLLRAKAVHYDLPFPVYLQCYHTDTYFILRSKFSLKSKSLKNACKYFGIPSKEHSFGFDTWYNAAKGDRVALNHVLEHNIEDVISTELLWKKISVYVAENKKSI